MNLQQTGKVDKGWGFEIIFANNEKYCGKLLVFPKAGGVTSLVLHKDKRKSWFVNSGKFKITYIDVASGEARESIIMEGQTADFAELSPHRLESMSDDSVIFEVSTGDYIEDRFRLSPGDSQRKPDPQ